MGALAGTGAGTQSITYAHLASMTDERGLFEHALLRTPRREHGYCTDDVARALTVVVNEPVSSVELVRMTGVYLSFLERAVDPRGAVHNRLSADGTWQDSPTIGDWWGRAVGGLGAAVRSAADPAMQYRASRVFLRAARRRSPDVRASAFAAVGAADVMAVSPESTVARALLRDCLRALPVDPALEGPRAGGWGWPEPRLRYANGALCSALLAGGEALNDELIVERGLTLLRALVRIETNAAGRLSVTGPRGRGPDDRGPQWDQQPLEVAAIADASARAFAITGDLGWADVVLRSWGWFHGENDSDTPMLDSATGAGFDGLEPHGRNENCGAESTLALITTAQCVRAVTRRIT